MLTLGMVGVVASFYNIKVQRNDLRKPSGKEHLHASRKLHFGIQNTLYFLILPFMPSVKKSIPVNNDSFRYLWDADSVIIML